jgi:hypothetical protein
VDLDRTVNSSPRLDFSSNLMTPQPNGRRDSKSPPSLSSGVVKKTRNRHACDACRRKRIKCCGTMPCVACVSADITCTYTPTKKRGIPTGFLQKLESSNEKLIGFVSLLLESLDDNNKKIVYNIAGRVANEPSSDTRKRCAQHRSQIMAMLDLEDFDEVPQRSALALSGSVAGSEAGLESSTLQFLRNSSSPESLGMFNNAALEELASARSRIDDITTTSNNNNNNVEDPNPTTANSELRFMGPSSGFDVSFSASFARLRLSSVSFDISTWKSLITPYSAMDLLDTFFSYTHTAIPMVDKSQLVQLLYSADANKKSGAGCLLWTAIMMGLNHLSAGTTDQDGYKSRIMHDLTICTLDCKYTLQSVQALLIQSFYFYGKGHWSNAWLIVGNAVRMGMDIGLNVMTPDTSSFSRRTWKCCCIIDTFIAARLGRVPQVARDNYFEVPEEEAPEEWELWRQSSNSSGVSSLDPDNSTAPWIAEPARTISIFNEFYEINKIATEFITEVNSPRYAQYTSSQRKELAQRIAGHLQAWTMQAPSHCSLLEFSRNPSAQLLPHKANLFLAFTGLVAMLYLVDSDCLEPYENVLSPEVVVVSTLDVMSAFVSHLSASKALPMFEYFLSLCLSICVRMSVDGQFPGSLSETPEFDKLHYYLNEVSRTWAGATVSYKYFQKVKENDFGDHGSEASPPTFASFTSTSLDSLSDMGEMDCFELLRRTMVVGADRRGL